MDRKFFFVTASLGILWLSGYRAGQGRWSLAFFEFLMFFVFMHFAVGKED